MPQFSIIIPVYRVEEYLEKCVDSILAQTCQDFELLLIDDGSPDGSGAICDRYAASHPNQVRALHQPNGGAGAARNRGIELAQGDYLLFVDGDDWLAPNLLEDLSASIAAASILAKVSRDRYVSTELERQYPQYQFARHKGYGTKLHYAMLDQYGPCPEHRQTFLKKWEARRI